MSSKIKSIKKYLLYAFLLICLVAVVVIYKFGIPTFDGQVAHEIDKLNLPVDSLQVDYESKNLILYELDLLPIAFSKASETKPYLESNMKIPKIEIKGIDWWKLYQDEILVADEIIITDFTADFDDNLLEYLSVKKQFPIDEIIVNKISFTSSNVKLRGKNEALGQYNIAINSARFQYPKIEMDLSRLDKFMYEIPENVQVGGVKISATKSLKALNCKSLLLSNSNCKLNQVTLRLEDGDQYIELADGDIILNEFDIRSFLESSNLVIKKLAINETASLKLHIDPKRHFTFPLPGEKAKINNLFIKTNQLNWQNSANPENHFVSSASADIRVSNLDLSDSKSRSGEVLGESLIIMTEVEVNLPRLNSRVNCKNLDFSSQNLVLSAGKIDFQNGMDIGFDRIDIEDEDILKITDSPIWEVDKLKVELNDLAVTEKDISIIDELGFENLIVNELYVSGKKLRVKSKKWSEIRVGNYTFSSTGFKYEKSEKNLSIIDYQVRLSKIVTLTQDRLHRISIGDAKWQNNKLACNDVSINPAQSNVGARSSRTKFNVLISSFTASSTDLLDVFADQTISIPSATISDANIRISTDENLSGNPEYKALLSEMIMNLDMPIDVNRMSVTNSRLEFNFTPEKDTEASQVILRNMNVELKNICNISERLRGNSKMSLDATGIFMTETPFKLGMQFEMLEKEFPYHYSFELGKLDLPEVNEILTDLAGLKIKEGKMDKMRGNINADKTNSKGLLDFYYSDLKVRYDKERFIAKWNPVDFMVTRFVLRKDNREKWDNETGIIEKRRDKSKSMFYQMWEAIFDGMKYVMLPAI